MSWFQVWTICWQVAIFITPIMVGAVVLWLKSQFVSKTELTSASNRLEARVNTDRLSADTQIKALEKTVADHETRLQLAEKDIARPPSRHQLNNALAMLQGQMHAVERGIADMSRQLETQNGYVHTIIEQHMVGAK